MIQKCWNFSKNMNIKKTEKERQKKIEHQRRLEELNERMNKPMGLPEKILLLFILAILAIPFAAIIVSTLFFTWPFILVVLFAAYISKMPPFTNR